jgi:hypothetical protein
MASGGENNMKERNYELIKCLDCSELFEAAIPYALKHSTRRYCDTCVRIRFSHNYRTRSDVDYYLNKQGYAQIRVNGKFVSEHRYVMEQKLGRPLNSVESVHHINGIRHDNDPNNLELWVGPIRYGQRAADIKCHSCGESYKID